MSFLKQEIPQPNMIETKQPIVDYRKPGETKGAHGRRLLQEAFELDPHWAWTWHCNIVAAVMTQDVDREAANRAATQFMKTAFEVDTSEEPKPIQVEEVVE